MARVFFIHSISMSPNWGFLLNSLKSPKAADFSAAVIPGFPLLNIYMI